MKHTLIWICMVLLAGMAMAQPPAVQWTHTYIGMTNPVPNAIIQTIDGGYVVGGVAEIYSAYLQKVNAAGTIQWRSWSFPAGSAHGHAVKDIVENPDSSLVVVGTNYNNPWDARYWFASKLTGAGANVWANVITNGFAYGDPWSLARCSDGGYAVGGENYAGLLRLSSTGQNLFERLYDGQLRMVQPMPDGSFTGAGTDYLSATAPNFYLVHTDALGVMSWQRTYAHSNYQYCLTMDCTSDSGYVLAGYDSSATTSDLAMFVMKVNSAGDTMWTRHYNTSWEDYVWDIHQTQDGGYLMLSYVGGSACVMKITAAGDSSWSVYANAWAMSPTQDGGFIIAGFNSSQLILTKYAPEAVPPPAPQDLTAIMTDAGLMLRWRSVPGVIGYQVHSADSVSGPYTLDASGTFADTTWIARADQARKFYYVSALR